MGFRFHSNSHSESFTSEIEFRWFRIVARPKEESHPCSGEQNGFDLFELLQFERSLVFTLLSYQLFDKLCQLSYLFSKLL